MKKAILIGKYDDATKEIGNCLSGQCQVMLCSEEQEIIEGMLQTEKPDLIVVVLSGSAVFARDMFTFLMPFGLPVLGIGTEKDKAELVINGYLSESRIRFLNKPAAPEEIVKCLGELGIQKDNSVAGGESGATILLVDDSPEFLRFMEAMLSRKYKVTFATSGTQAIVSVAKSKPDLILLDYEMPVCDGKMTLEMLRSDEDMKDIPVVFLTGISDARHVSEVVALHPQGYLLKPCSEEIVFSTIEKVLREKNNLLS